MENLILAITLPGELLEIPENPLADCPWGDAR